MNTPVTSAVERETRRAAIVACFVFQREISRYVFWDFFDSIGPFRPCWASRRMSAPEGATDTPLKWSDFGF